MREILSDLVAEEQQLDQFLQRLAIRDWKLKIPGTKRTIQETVGYLALMEELGFAALDGGDPRANLADSSRDPIQEIATKRANAMRPQDVIEWWRHTRASVVEVLSRMEGHEVVEWLDGRMDTRTFASYRLTDTWSEGLGIHDALDSEIEDTPRLRHVAWYGWRSLPQDFSTAGEDYPEPVRVELIGSNYAKWVFGPTETEEWIKGKAGDWCRVVVRHIKAADTDLRSNGDLAAKALRLAGESS